MIRSLKLARTLAAAAAVVVLVGACSGTSGSAAPSGSAGAGKQYVVGVSNTLQGNGWREEMICSIKAQALASGQVSKVVVANRNTDTAGQIEDLRSLISSGVNAIILNPTSDTALNDVIKEATDKGIAVVAVDQGVTAPTAYVLSNDQENYGYLGAKWLFDKLGGKGNVVYMRGIEGVPADTDRDKGFKRALAEYPNIKVVKETFTGWDITKGAQQIQDIFSAGTQFDGVWTSGIDASVIDAFKTAKQQFKPIVGADNNAFVGYLDTEKANGLVGAAVTNPPPVGGAGVALALKVLNGQAPSDHVVKLTPAVWDNSTDSGLQTLKGAYDKTLDPYYGVNYTIPDWTTYDKAQLVACKGPGE
jgi:ribose transport system substrate-binding protein